MQNKKYIYKNCKGAVEKRERKHFKIRKWLAFLLFVCIALTGFAGVMFDFNTYAVAEVNVEIPAKDNRTIKEQVWDMLDNYGLTIDEKIKAVSIISCESNWDKYAVGVNKNTRDYGLWQINSIHKLSKECMFDVECSTNWAINKYRKDGNWNAWVCSK